MSTKIKILFAILIAGILIDTVLLLYPTEPIENYAGYKDNTKQEEVVEEPTEHDLDPVEITSDYQF